MNLFIVLIPVLQAIENKSYYINLYKYEKELHIKTRNLSDTNNLWVNYRLLPAMYDRENIRFYWALSKLNNIENFVQNGDLFVVNDKEELNLVKDIGTKKNMKITEIYNSSLVSEGLLRINGRRTDSLKFEIYKIDESNK